MYALKLLTGRHPAAWGCLLLALVLAAALPAAAKVNETLSYQGRLLDGGGRAVTDTVDIVFTIYDAASGGAALWTESHTNVSVDTGAYGVVLGLTTPIALERETDYWLGINVEGDGEMTPRIPLTGQPFSLLPNLGRQTILVAKTNGDYDTINKALADTWDAAAAKPYLIKVGPGTYNERVVLPDYVSLQGAGMGVTILTSTGSGTLGTAATLETAEDSEVSHLTIINTGGAANAVGIDHYNANSLIHDVEVQVSGGTSENRALWSTSAPPTVANASFSASGGEKAYGIYVYTTAQISLTQVTAHGENATVENHGLYCQSGQIAARGCTFSAQVPDEAAYASANTYGLYEQGEGSVLRDCTMQGTGGDYATGYTGVGASLVTNLTGCRILGVDGHAHTQGAYVYASTIELTNCELEATNSSLTTSYDVDCLQVPAGGNVSLHGVKLTASGGGYAVGMNFGGANVSGLDTWAKAEGGSVETIGGIFYNTTASVSNAVFHADGYVDPGASSDNVTGLSVSGTSTAALGNSIMVAENAASLNEGMYVVGTATVNMANCQLIGEQRTMFNQSGAVTVGGSQLSGGPVNTGTGTTACSNCFDEDYAALDATCQ